MGTGSTFRGGLAAACLVAALAGCSPDEAPPPAQPRLVRVTEVHLQQAALDATGTGMIESRYSADVGFLISGRLVERKVDVGTTVKKGDVLARIDPADQQTKLQAAEATVRSAQADLDRATPQEARYRKLLGDGFVSQTQYDQTLQALRAAQANLKSAKANFTLAQDQLGYATIYAGDDGVVTAVGPSPGQVVSPGQMVVQIAQLDQREAVFAVAETRIGYAYPGMPITVALQSDPKVSVAGTIREIAPSADPVTRTYTIRVSLTNPPDGMRMGAIVVGKAELKGSTVIQIPSSALLQTGAAPAVWLAAPSGNGNAAVHKAAVKVLRYEADSVLIESGVKEGDLVVTAGVNLLAEGQVVRLPTKEPT